jgi:hypothetical protein
MKGFVKILEAFIASIILLAALSFYINPYIQRYDWSKTILETKTKSTLVVLDYSGYLDQLVRGNNKTGLTAKLDSLLPKSIEYSVEVYGIPNPQINIACNCTDSEIDLLKDILQPQTFLFKNREIDLRINKTSLLYIDPRANVLLIFGYKNLSDYMLKLNDFLENGGTLFIVTDLNEAQTNDGVFNDIFGLEWDESGGPNPHPEKLFFNTTDPSKKSYKIADYFVNTPIRVNTSAGPGVFYISGDPYTIDTVMNETGEYVLFESNYYEKGETFVVNGYDVLVYDLDANSSDEDAGFREYADIGILNKQYTFVNPTPGLNLIKVDNKTILETKDGLSASKVNFYITDYGHGRTVWVVDYDKSMTDWNQLFRSLMLWASGERYNMDLYEKKTGRVYTQVQYIVSGDTVFEPYEITLKVWHIFY